MTLEGISMHEPGKKYDGLVYGRPVKMLEKSVLSALDMDIKGPHTL
jgi:hypothetical protein